jgi:hypothetical protein
MNSPFFVPFPGPPQWNASAHEFKNTLELADYDWTGVGHTQPFVVGDINGGGVTLGSGSANSADYIQAQQVGASILLNSLAKTYKFEWQMQLSSATLTQAMMAMAVTNTSLMTTNIANGFGFYCNNVNGLTATGEWVGFLCNGSTTQYTTYTQFNALASDVNKHTFSIEVITDPATLGAGQIIYFIDSVQVGSLSNSGTAILPQVGLRNSFAIGNGSAVAQTGIVFSAAQQGQAF